MKSYEATLPISLFLTTFLFLSGIALALNQVRVECPVIGLTACVGDSIAIPVHMTNVSDLNGFTLGFHYNSDMVEITSIAKGTIFPIGTTFHRSFLPASNQVLVGWIDLSGDKPLNPQVDGLAFTLYMKLLPGITAHWVDLDSTYVPPAGPFIFAPTTGGKITPDYVDCGPQDISIGPSWTISGSVKTSAGAGISGVVMNGLPGPISTDVNGDYSAAVCGYWSGKVTPSCSCYAFSPPSMSYSEVTSNQVTNYVGTTLTYTISGSVRNSAGVSISDVVMNGLPGPPITDIGGHYSATVTCGWSGTVTPSKPRYTFSPFSTPYGNVTSNQTTNYVSCCPPFNQVRVECPVIGLTACVGDSIAIPVHMTNVSDLNGFTLGFHYNSDMVEITSIAKGTIFPIGTTFHRSFLPASNQVLVGWIDLSGDKPLNPQVDGLAFTLYMKLLPGITAHWVDLDSTYVPPAGPFIFAPTTGGKITPDYVDCSRQDVSIGMAENIEVTITSPSVLSAWAVGSRQRISWTLSGGSTDNITIYVSRDGGATYEPEPIADFGYQGINRFDWTVTDPASENCRIKIVAIGPQGLGTAISNGFKIVGRPGFFVHITDLHVTAGNNEGWPEKLDFIRRMNPAPAFVVASGDVVNWGYGESGEANYRELLAPLHGSRGNWFIDEEEMMPIYFCPGNHDAYGEFFWEVGTTRQGFQNYEDSISSLYYTVFPPGTNLALYSLNSGMDQTGEWPEDWSPESEGLDANLLSRLGTNPEGVDVAGKRKIVFMHHPHLDDGRFLNNVEQFIDSCDKYVEAVLCGHIHSKPGEWEIAGIFGQVWKYLGHELPYKADGTNWDISSDIGQTAFVVTREMQNDRGHNGFYRRVDFDSDGKITWISGNLEFSFSGIEIVKVCPVDLIVTDPIGATIGRWSSTIEDASYEMYELTPGDTGATIYIPHPRLGDYNIAVAPAESAAPTDDYSLYFANGSDTVCLAQDSLISTIPEAGFQVTVTTVDVEDEDYQPLLPEKPVLDQNYPNPFNSSTTVKFDLDRPNDVEFTVFNSLGQTVRSIFMPRQAAGSYQLTWEGCDDQGRAVASGVYFYQIKAGGIVLSKKMVMLK